MTDNAIIRKDGATAGHVQESGATIDDNGTVNIPAGQTYNINGSEHTHAGGGGAPTTAEYITSAADGTLSAEVVIPGLAGSPDISAAAGAGTSEEYDTSTTGITWSPSDPNTVNSDTTIKSHLYIKATTNTEYIGTKAWTPAGAAAFDARCKIGAIGNGITESCAIGLHIGDSGNSNRLLLQLNAIPGTTRQYQVNSYTYAGGAYTQRGSNWLVGGNDCYLRITRDGSNNCSFYWSTNGLLWQLIATQALTLTVANIGYRVSQAAALTHEMAIDWLRTDV